MTGTHVISLRCHETGHQGDAAFAHSEKLRRKVEGAVPLIRKWHRFEYEQHFMRVAEWERLFSGVYPSFAAANAAIPAGRNNSYDNPASATFLGYKSSIRSSDYPVLFWLEKLLPEKSAGVRFWRLSGHFLLLISEALEYPANLQWTIYDVPAVVAAGRKLAEDKDERRNSPSRLI